MTIWNSYVHDLTAAIDLHLIKGSDVRVGVDPLGGGSLAYPDTMRSSTNRSQTPAIVILKPHGIWWRN
jgi:phosphoglucomutase